MELLTQKQRERVETYRMVEREYNAMRRKYPEAANGRIFADMAARNIGGLTSVAGVRKVLIKVGAVPATQNVAL